MSMSNTTKRVKEIRRKTRRKFSSTSLGNWRMPLLNGWHTTTMSGITNHWIT